ncbi:MAG TPA: hypothetical protein VGE23_00840 [Candidatus Paceibacterota bacterium]
MQPWYRPIGILLLLFVAVPSLRFAHVGVPGPWLRTLLILFVLSGVLLVLARNHKKSHADFAFLVLLGTLCTPWLIRIVRHGEFSILHALERLP